MISWFAAEYPGTYLTATGRIAPAYRVGRFCYWQTRGDHWHRGDLDRFTDETK